MRKIFIFLNIILVILFILSFLIHENNAFDQDLGRHVKLGEIILKTKNIPTTNLFTFTNPDFPFINHHWLSEIIFYILNNNLGSISITIFKIFILFSAFSLILYVSYKKSSYSSSILAFLIFSPFLMSRTDERPEIFGILFFSIYLFIFLLKKTKIFFLIPIISFLWINTHITFIYGFFILFIFNIYYFLFEKNLFKKIFLISVISFLTSMINPQGIIGIFYPLFMFKNYEYTIVENQNLFYLQSVISNFYIQYFWPSLFVLIIFAIWNFFKKIENKNLIYYFLIFSFTILGIVMFRNFPFFGIIAILTGAFFIHKSLKNIDYVLYISPIILIIYIYLITSNSFYSFFDINKSFSLNQNQNYKNGVLFFQKNNLKDPIFNNFDIGGYLDYSLYPKIKTFVDNRPEAFPNNFFIKYKDDLTYLEKTEEMLRKYQVNTIIISHTDATGWNKEFVKNLPKITDFKIVYIDSFTLIATKNSKLKEIDTQRLKNLINKTNDYKELLNLANITFLLNYSELSKIAIEKAYNINSISCATRLSYGIDLINEKNYYLQKKGINIFSSIWGCPLTRDTSKEIENITKLD